MIGSVCPVITAFCAVLTKHVLKKMEERLKTGHEVLEKKRVKEQLKSKEKHLKTFKLEKKGSIYHTKQVHKAKKWNN